MAYWLYEKLESDLLSEKVLSEEAESQNRDEDGRGRPRSRLRKGEVGKFGKAEVLRTGSDRNNFAILL